MQDRKRNPYPPQGPKWELWEWFKRNHMIEKLPEDDVLDAVLMAQGHRRPW